MAALIAAITSVVGWPRRHESAGMPTPAGCLHPRGGGPGHPRPGFGQRDRFHPERGSLRPWLYGIATNLVARHRRKEARHYRALARAAAEPPADGHENRVLAAVTAQRLQPQLARALTLLTPGERDVLLLVALSQLSHEEVAEALGITYSTVASRLSRARKKLKTAIDQEEVNG
jgi:RNA polymerase sigma-70 factor (ECF subfamily)